MRGARRLDDISPDEILHFLDDLTRDLAKSTRRLRYAQFKAFFNFISGKLAEYIKEKAIQGEMRIFFVCYSTARSLVRGLGAKLNNHEFGLDIGSLTVG